jgi:hypothetical protein
VPEPAAEASPVPATRARVVVLGLPVALVLVDDERPAVALLVVLVLAAFLGAARLAVARPEAVALWRRSPVVPAAMIDYLTPRVITNTGGGRWIGPPRVPSTRRAARLCPEEYPPRCPAETRPPCQSATVSGCCFVTRSDAINHPQVQFLPNLIFQSAACRLIGRNPKIEEHRRGPAQQSSAAAAAKLGEAGADRGLVAGDLHNLGTARRPGDQEDLPPTHSEGIGDGC